MAILKILKYPHPVLRIPAALVDAAELAGLQSVIDDMIDTMRAAPGAIGLAAPQVGVSKRIVVLDMAARSQGAEPGAPSALQVIVNPVITEASRNKMMREGCLSFPEYLASVKRATRLTYTSLDRDGETHVRAVRDLEAIAIQHEIDHLDGILMIDRVSSLKTDWIRRQASSS